jgi:2,4-dienoyl-CoA reductase-like NADH-dependent reductase (Old Yellow Enzyme family)/thioredoxin reductase
MHPKYPKMFSPIKLGPIEIPNRFYSSPHATPLVTARGGPTQDYINYNVERTKGGAGLLIVSVSALERSRFVQPSAYPKENIAGYRAFADAVHAAGGKVFGELWYWWGAAGPWGPLSPPAPSMSASQAQYNLFGNRLVTREMTKGEILMMQQTFRQSAENLCEAGFDGIMLHGSHGALPEQFISPYFNHRTDDYGGSLENRLRFAMEILAGLREVARDKMAIGFRMNCDELVKGGYDTKDAYQILKKISESGFIDFADLDVAIEPDQYHIGMPPVFVEPHSYRPYVEAVRSAAGSLPVLSVLGRLTSIADGEQALVAGVCDMVGAARALIAEPQLVNNARDGKEDRSRTCIACNWCMASLYYDGAQNCTINPASWREGHWGVDTFTPAPKKSKVIVVGSGPAGLEAARVSALRGHSVTLYEARDRLGGAMTLWAGIPGRGFYQKSIEWWERELHRLGVAIHVGSKATAASILAQRPDAVILATGAVYSPEGNSNHRDFAIPGHDRDFVYRPEDILLGKAHLSGKIVILDAEGMQTGVGIAELLALQGADVEYLTPLLTPISLRVMATQDAPYIMKRLRAAGVKISTSTYIKAIADHAVTVYDVFSEQESEIKSVNAVILSTGRTSVNELEKALEGKVGQLFAIGDAAAARIWPVASYEGQKFARYIGEPNAPATIGQVYFSEMTADP